VPLQIGARGIQWPRAALAAVWMLIAGGLIMWGGFLTTRGAAAGGWTAFDPLSDTPSSPGPGMDYWIVGVVLSSLAAIVWAACLLATIVRHRVPGMTLLRMPLLTWGVLVACLMTVTSFPALIVAMVLLYIDRHGGGVFVLPDGPLAYQHLFWFYGHPVVYVVFFPWVGAVAETVATFSGQRFFGYRLTVLSLLAFAALSMSVWGHHMFVTDSVANRYFSLTSTALLVPAGIEYFGLLATMFRGRIRLGAPMLFALGFVLLFLIGGLTGIFVGSPELNYHVHDSYFIVAHFHYTLFGGTVFGMFAAIYLWFPKVTGRLLGERLARWHFVLMFVGALMTFIPMFFLGHEGMPRRVANYSASDGWETLNVVATVGGYVILISIALFLVNVLRSLRAGRPAGPDPWEGHTLEWATSSPPPPENFTAPLPPVRSYAPLLDLREEEAAAR
jgi:cytochrome c oxidase subunit I